MKNIYLIDTSSLVEMKDKYPENIFPNVWKKMEELHRENRLFAPYEVKKEIIVIDDELKKWIKGKKKMFIKPDKFQLCKVKEILEKFPFLAKPEKLGPNADPWLLALAIEKELQKDRNLFDEEKYIIVTEESKRKRERIPTVAQYYNIECINLIELFKKEGWKF